MSNDFPAPAVILPQTARCANCRHWAIAETEFYAHWAGRPRRFSACNASGEPRAPALSGLEGPAFTWEGQRCPAWEEYREREGAADPRGVETPPPAEAGLDCPGSFGGRL